MTQRLLWSEMGGPSPPQRPREHGMVPACTWGEGKVSWGHIAPCLDAQMDSSGHQEPLKASEPPKGIIIRSVIGSLHTGVLEAQGNGCGLVLSKAQRLGEGPPAAVRLEGGEGPESEQVGDCVTRKHSSALRFNS